MKDFKIQNCPICKSNIKNEAIIKPDIDPLKSLKIRKKLWTIFQSERIFFPYHRCQCGLLTNKIFLKEKMLKHLYSDMSDNVHSGEDVQNDIKTKNGYLNQLKDILYKKKDLKFLEIGADNGNFLSLVKKTNPKVKSIVVEPNKRMHKKLKSLTNKVYNDIKKVPKNEKFDLIVAIHVFNHVPNFLRFLKILKNKLKKGGFIYGVVHDEKSVMAKILGNRWPAYRLQHPHLFNPTTINKAFLKLKCNKKFIKKTVNFFNFGFLLKHLIMAVFKKKINFPNFFTIGLKLGNFSFLYYK